MSEREQGTVLRQARWVFLSLAIALAIAASSAGSDEPLSLEGIKSRLSEQRERIQSLHIRIRRQTETSVAPTVLASWSDRLSVPKYLGTDEVLVAFKGDKRYFRFLELDYKPLVPAEPSSETGNRTRPYLDESKVWSGEVLRQRSRNLQSGEYEYHCLPAEEARDCFPPLAYLMNVGLAVPDPTGKDEALRNLQQLAFLPELLGRWRYEVSPRAEKMDGAACLVLEGKMQCRLPVGEAVKNRSVSDKLWLDPQRGLAVRKRETRIDGRLVRVVNRDFGEVIAGLWLPRESQTESWAPPEALEQHRDHPVLVRRMRLLLWVINEVPDGLFDIALTKPPSSRVAAFDVAPAYHFRRIAPSMPGDRIGEEWAVRGVGRRYEIRKGSKLELLVVDTPRWHFVWEPTRSRVMASPSQLGTPRVDDRVPECAETIRRWEELTAVVACRNEELEGTAVDKVIGYFPADPKHWGDWPIHWFDPKLQLTVSGTESRTRTYWFDRKTHLGVRRQCGCKSPKWEWWADYPTPEGLPRELLTFQVPPAARLEVSDPELGRQLYSEGHTESHLRP